MKKKKEKRNFAYNDRSHLSGKKSYPEALQPPPPFLTRVRACVYRSNKIND